MADYSDYKECTDCVHYELCLHQEKFLIEHNRKDLIRRYGFGLSEPEICCNFRDRSRFVELPCRVGDKVYFNNVHLRYARVIAIYIDASGGMFDLDITTNIATATGYEHFINKDYTFEDIGKRLFLTREAAEQALKLKERENNAE